MRLSAVTLGLICAFPASADPIFAPREIAPHVYDGGWEFFVGGGLSSFDCNGDGLPELFAAGGANPAQLFLNESAQDLAFTPVETPLSVTEVIGSYPLDIDNDANLDLVILRVGQNLIFRGDGLCGFEVWAGLDLPDDDSWTTAFSATWERGQDLPSLAFGNYVDRSDPEGPFGTCAANDLYRPAGDGYATRHSLEPGFCALSMLFTDWGRQGQADLRISNDRHYYIRDGAEQLWAMDATPRLYTEADGWQRHQLWGMGIASQDITGDGLAEVYLTSMGDQRLQFRDTTGAAPTFTDAPFDQGTTAHRPYTGGDGRPSTGWHPVFGDVDNDGWIDLFVTKGNVEQMPGSAMEDPNNLLRGLPDGRFVEVGLPAGIATFERSRGAVLTDLNADGLLDIAVVNRGAPMELYQNVTDDAGGWLSLEVTQARANRFAVGAIVDVRAGGRLWSREITVGGGHAGGSAGLLHFGVGTTARVDVTVHWPDGALTEFTDLPTGQAHRLERP